MTTEDLHKLRTLLEAEKGLIEGELSRIATKDPLVHDNYNATMEPLDRSDDEEANARIVTDFAVNKDVEQTLELRLQEITRTLKEIAEGHYGQHS